MAHVISASMKIKNFRIVGLRSAQMQLREREGGSMWSHFKSRLD